MPHSGIIVSYVARAAMRFSSRARTASQWRIGELIKLELRLPYMLWRRMTDGLRKRSGTALPVPLGEQPRLTSPVVAPAHARTCSSTGRRTKRAKWASDTFTVHELRVAGRNRPR